jgi:ubiquinone/menaquinone biosynthesis C-methylase UbiE
MNQQEEQLAEQKHIWNEYSAGWKKWDELLMTMMRPVADSLAESLNLSGNEHVLDVASGTGEPGLTLTSLLAKGQVTGSDLSENMVKIANEHAQARGIKNYHSQQVDATKMSFADNSFDHIICRFGIMFFPDIKTGLQEMTRVLKPGGKLSVAVWASPELNSFLTLIGSTVIEKLNLPRPTTDAPGIFRCAQPGMTSQLLTSAGLSEVVEYNVAGEATYESSENYWEVSADVAGPIMDALKKSPRAVIDEVKEEVLRKAENLLKNGKVAASWEAIIATGSKK